MTHYKFWVGEILPKNTKITCNALETFYYVLKKDVYIVKTDIKFQFKMYEYKTILDFIKFTPSTHIGFAKIIFSLLVVC